MEVHNSSALVLAVIYLLILQQDSAPILWAFPKIYPIVSQNILTIQKKKKKGEKVYGIENITKSIHFSIPSTCAFKIFAILNDAKISLL